MDLTEFVLRLKLQKNIGYVKSLKVLRQLPTLSEIDESCLDQLDLPKSLKQDVTKAMHNEKSRSLIFQLHSQCTVISFFDERYPAQLREIYQPPLILFAKGNLNLLRKKITTIVGSRQPTSYSQEVLSHLIPVLIKKKIVIASGLAQGVDTIAHRETLSANGKTIAVVGNGLNHFYPRQNQRLQDEISRHGLLISEYLPDTPPRPFRFPERNRILAGLSENVIVTEAKHHSGSLITANLALQENRNIYAVPGPITSLLSRGPNELIAAGAQPLIDYSLE